MLIDCPRLFAGSVHAVGRHLLNEQSIELGQTICREAESTADGRTKKRKRTGDSSAPISAGFNRHQAMISDLLGKTKAQISQKSVPHRQERSKMLTLKKMKERSAAVVAAMSALELCEAEMHQYAVSASTSLFAGLETLAARLG